MAELILLGQGGQDNLTLKATKSGNERSEPSSDSATYHMWDSG